jgi:hypothetical protein
MTKIKLDIADIDDDLYGLLLEAFQKQANKQGIDFSHVHWIAEAYLNEETYLENVE